MVIVLLAVVPYAVRSSAPPGALWTPTTPGPLTWIRKTPPGAITARFADGP
jgi:hypothetical protein